MRKSSNPFAAKLATLLLGGLAGCSMGTVDRNEAGTSAAPSVAARPVQLAPDATSEPPAPLVFPGFNLPEGCGARLGDCVPEDAATWRIDCDGDGVPGYRAVECAANNALPLSDDAKDCNDSNADWFVEVTEDADGDGFGADTRGTCTHPELIPEGYASRTPHPDCNDQDSAVHPLALDIWGDQVDTDCNATDTANCEQLALGGPVVFTEAAGGPTGATDDEAMSSDATSDAGKADAGETNLQTECRADVDLFVSDFVVCWNCASAAGTAHAFVGNRGTARYEEAIEVRWRQTLGSEIVEGAFLIPAGLAPGEGTAAYEFDLRLGGVELTLHWPEDELRDCQPDNELSLASRGRCT